MTKVSSQLRLPDPTVPGSLLIRFRRTAMLVQVIGATLLVAGVAGATYALSTGRLDDYRYVEFLEPVTLASAVATASGAMLLLAGISRTTQVRRSRGVAFAVDPVGVYLGAERGGGRPVFVPWPDVRALVLCEATEGSPDQTIRRSVGVLLHPGHPHGMRAFFDRLSRVDLRTLPRRRRDEARVALTRARARSGPGRAGDVRPARARLVGALGGAAGRRRPAAAGHPGRTFRRRPPLVDRLAQPARAVRALTSASL